MRDIGGDPAFVKGWDDAMKHQRIQKAAESQSIDLTLLASTPMHNRLTFERAEAVEEKMAERLRQGGSSKFYHGWMEEIDHLVAQHEQEEGQPHSAPNRPNRMPSQLRCVVLCRVVLIPVLKREQYDREGSYAGGSGSRSAASRARVLSLRTRNMQGESVPNTLDDNNSGDVSPKTSGRQKSRK
jgi:hypothetical protein